MYKGTAYRSRSVIHTGTSEARYSMQHRQCILPEGSCRLLHEPCKPYAPGLRTAPASKHTRCFFPVDFRQLKTGRYFSYLWSYREEMNETWVWRTPTPEHRGLLSHLLHWQTHSLTGSAHILLSGIQATLSVLRRSSWAVVQLAMLAFWHPPLHPFPFEIH